MHSKAGLSEACPSTSGDLSDPSAGVAEVHQVVGLVGMESGVGSPPPPRTSGSGRESLPGHLSHLGSPAPVLPFKGPSRGALGGMRWAPGGMGGGENHRQSRR